MDRRKILVRQILKYSILSVSVFLLYILQSTPGFLNIFGIKPTFIFPFCITLSMLDENWQTIIIYVLGGLFLELSSGRIVGYFTIPLLITGLCGVIAVKFFFKPNIRNSYIFSFMAMLILLTVDFFLSYVLTGYTYAGGIFLRQVVLISAYSSIFAVPFHWFIEFVNQRFRRFDAR